MACRREREHSFFVVVVSDQIKPPRTNNYISRDELREGWIGNDGGRREHSFNKGNQHSRVTDENFIQNFLIRFKKLLISYMHILRKKHPITNFSAALNILSSLLECSFPSLVLFLVTRFTSHLLGSPSSFSDGRMEAGVLRWLSRQARSSPLFL